MLPLSAAVGSAGRAAKYLGIKESQKACPVVVFVIYVGVVNAEDGAPGGRSPLLSAAYWLMAFRMAMTSAFLFVLLAWANCLAGLMAIRTIARRIAKIPITTKSSMRVKPFDMLRVFDLFDVCNWAEVIVFYLN